MERLIIKVKESLITIFIVLSSTNIFASVDNQISILAWYQVIGKRFRYPL